MNARTMIFSWLHGVIFSLNSFLFFLITIFIDLRIYAHILGDSYLDYTRMIRYLNECLHHDIFCRLGCRGNSNTIICGHPALPHYHCHPFSYYRIENNTQVWAGSATGAACRRDIYLLVENMAGNRQT
ncbi:hypothetical protein D1007_07655 [Hordeum vulgare]|nr:hypothetical protein D1007_07655 [Hordeum vulgare]